MSSRYEKIKFPKKELTLTLEELGIEDAPGVIFTFWENPSKPVVYAIFDIVMAAAEELQGLSEAKMSEVEHKYYTAVSEIIIDCNVEGLDFSTREQALKAFESADLPVGLMHEVVTCYLRHLMEYNVSVKKALALYLLGSATGRDGARKAKRSMTESSQTPKKNSQSS